MADVFLEAVHCAPEWMPFLELVKQVSGSEELGTISAHNVVKYTGLNLVGEGEDDPGPDARIFCVRFDDEETVADFMTRFAAALNARPDLEPMAQRARVSIIVRLGDDVYVLFPIPALSASGFGPTTMQ